MLKQKEKSISGRDSRPLPLGRRSQCCSTGVVREINVVTEQMQAVLKTSSLSRSKGAVSRPKD